MILFEGCKPIPFQQMRLQTIRLDVIEIKAIHAQQQLDLVNSHEGLQVVEVLLWSPLSLGSLISLWSLLEWHEAQTSFLDRLPKQLGLLVHHLVAIANSRSEQTRKSRMVLGHAILVEVLSLLLQAFLQLLGPLALHLVSQRQHRFGQRRNVASGEQHLRLLADVECLANHTRALHGLGWHLALMRSLGQPHHHRACFGLNIGGGVLLFGQVLVKLSLSEEVPSAFASCEIVLESVSLDEELGGSLVSSLANHQAAILLGLIGQREEGLHRIHRARINNRFL